MQDIVPKNLKILPFQNLSGIFTSATSLIVLYTSTSPTTFGILYFGTITLILLLCLITYLRLPFIEFYQHHELKINESSTEQDLHSTTSRTSKWDGYRNVLKQCWVQCYNVFMVFFVTLSVFPSVFANVKRFDQEFLIEDDRYFTEVTCFFTFSLTAFFGNICAGWVEWVK